jgi:hypothetical protein
MYFEFEIAVPKNKRLNIIKCCGKKSCSDVGSKKNSSSRPTQNYKDDLAKKNEASRFPKPLASLTPGPIVLNNNKIQVHKNLKDMVIIQKCIFSYWILMVLFLSPKKFGSSNTFLKETTDQNRELPVADESTMKLKESANGVVIGDNENSSRNNGEAIKQQQKEPMDYSQLEPQSTANKDGNGGNAVKNGASAGRGQLLGRNLISATTANKYANAENSLENGALAGNGQPLGRATASPAANKDAKAGNSVENVGLVGTGPQLMSKTDAARQRQQPAADGSNNLILASTDLKLAAPTRTLQILNSATQKRQSESVSDSNSSKYYATNASNNKIAINYSTNDNASRITQQLNLASESIATGENGTKNGTLENSTGENSAANSNSEGTGFLNNDESMANFSNADSPSDVAIIMSYDDDEIENVNGTMLTNDSAAKSVDWENAEDGAEATTESTITEREILAAEDKYVEIVPDYNELDANGQTVNSKLLLF